MCVLTKCQVTPERHPVLRKEVGSQATMWIGSVGQPVVKTPAVCTLCWPCNASFPLQTVRKEGQNDCDYVKHPAVSSQVKPPDKCAQANSSASECHETPTPVDLAAAVQSLASSGTAEQQMHVMGLPPNKYISGRGSSTGPLIRCQVC